MNPKSFTTDGSTKNKKTAIVIIAAVVCIALAIAAFVLFQMKTPANTSTTDTTQVENPGPSMYNTSSTSAAPADGEATSGERPTKPIEGRE